MSTAAHGGARLPNTARQYQLPDSELPWRCPLPGTSHWNSHPQVFLWPDPQGHARCPYCSAEFSRSGKANGSASA